MEETIIKNPWLGLESYKEGEVLYGRDEDIRDLSQRVLNDTDTLLYGKSGIGKSSILNAGIIPAARRYGYLPVLVRLSHKEQQTYLLQIKDAIGNETVSTQEVVKCKDAEKETLYEYFHRQTFHNAEGERIKLLIIFDQFEEIFTLQEDESKKKRFFTELADFLNDVMPADLQHNATAATEPQKKKTVIGAGNFGNLFNDLKLGADNDLPEYVTDNEIHLVFTIREDFLSEFEYYSASIPSLKQNRYGLRPINEEQAAQIILRPMPGLIDDSVAKLIIEKVTGRTDFELDGIPEIEVDSAVLSLYLNRLYDAKTGDTITSELVEQKGGEIIADFYLDAISEISEPTVEYLEDMLLNGNGRRDNITVFDAIHDGGATEQELDALCNKKKILRQFNYAGDLRIEYVHDILCPVVKAHKEERTLLKQQEEERKKQEEEKNKLLLAEKTKREKIEKEAEAEKARLRAEAARTRKRNRARLIAVGSIVLLLALGIFVYYFLFKMPFKTSYATFTTKDGWPIGIGKILDNGDKKQMPVYYQLVKYGYWSKFTRVNVLNNHKDLTRNKFNESPLVGLYETEGEDKKAKKFAIMQRQTAYWEYSSDNDGNVLRKTAFDPDGNELYAVQYFRSSVLSADANEEGVQKKQLWANYVDKDGKAMRVRDNGADRVRIIVNDSSGYYIGYQFYSETGTPQPNHNGAYGYRYQIGDDGRNLKKVPVDAFGDQVEEEGTTYEAFDEYGRWTQANGGKAEYNKQLVVFAIKNRTDTLKFGDKGELLYHSETKKSGEKRFFHYDKGQVVESYHYRPSNNGMELAYSKRVLPQKNKNILETLEFWKDSVVQYRIKREERSVHKMTVAYFEGEEVSAINRPKTVNMADGRYHKLELDTTNNSGFTVVTKRYLDAKGNLSEDCEFNKDIAYYNKNKEMIKHIVFKGTKRIYAYLNEYEDGQITAQSVLGIDDSTPIRFAGWDKYGLTYYKMKLIYNFSNTLVAVKGINEFGEESLITIGTENYKISIVPSVEMSMTEGDADIYGLQVYKVQTPPVEKEKSVEYIHILNKEGTWYQAGVRDGDILINEGSLLKIAHPVISEKTYEVKSLTVGEGMAGAEHYPVYFTEKEIERYRNAIKTKK